MTTMDNLKTRTRADCDFFRNICHTCAWVTLPKYDTDRIKENPHTSAGMIKSNLLILEWLKQPMKYNSLRSIITYVYSWWTFF